MATDNKQDCKSSSNLRISLCHNNVCPEGSSMCGEGEQLHKPGRFFSQPSNPINQNSPIHLYGKYSLCHIILTYSRDHQCIQSASTNAVTLYLPISWVNTIFRMCSQECGPQECANATRLPLEERQMLWILLELERASGEGNTMARKLIVHGTSSFNT